jgi:hypothetical protein
MFGTIVIGADGSGPAGRAVETAAEIAAGTKDKVVVFHGVVVYHTWGKDVPAEAADETQQLVDRYVAQLAAAGVTATGEVYRDLGKGSSVVHYPGRRHCTRYRVRWHDRGADGPGVLRLGRGLGRPPRRGALFGHRAAEPGSAGGDRRHPGHRLDADRLPAGTVG